MGPELLLYPKALGGSADGTDVTDENTVQHLVSPNASEEYGPDQYRQVNIGVGENVQVQFVVLDDGDALARCNEKLAEVVRAGLKSA